MVVAIFLGDFWGPRTPSFYCNEEESTSLADLNVFRSSAVSSHTSPS